MAFFQCSYFSKVLSKNVGVNVILPEDNLYGMPNIYDEEGKLPVVYLLHGYTDDYTKWMRSTAIELYAQEHRVAVVMPDAGKSFYTDMAYGDPYYTYITEELPETICGWFPISRKREYNYIAGISMGGYGAMKIGLSRPEQYSAVGSFSGLLAIQGMAGQDIPDEFPDFVKQSAKDLQLAFGDMNNVENGPNDPIWLVNKLVSEGKQFPELYLSCGTNDFIYQSTVGFREYLKSLNIPFQYHEEPAAHEWHFWDREVNKFLAWANEDK